MNHNDITPEECRIAARLLRRDDFQADCGGYSAEAAWFERKAEQIEREQDEKRRFAEAFHVFDQARREYWTQPTPGDRPAYIPAAEEESYRAGVRALLAQLEQQKTEPRTWNDLRDVPDDVQKVNDITGSMYRRFKPGPRGWEVHASGTMWSRGMDDDLSEYAPFTEAPREL